MMCAVVLAGPLAAAELAAPVRPAADPWPVLWRIPTFSLLDIQDEYVETQDLFGSASASAVLLVFYQNSCKSCLEEMPQVRQLHATLSAEKRSLNVVYVNVGDDLDSIVAISRKHKLTFPILRDEDKDVFGAFAKGLKRYPGTPMIVVVQPRGNVIFAQTGVMDMVRVTEALRYAAPLRSR